MRFSPALSVSLLVLLAATPAPTPSDLPGFAAASSATEREWESKFRDMPVPDSMREAMRRLSARPHHLGSPYDKDNAEWLLARFKSYGWDASIEEFQVLFPTPKERVVELVAPTKFVASLQETGLAIDPTSKQRSEQLPTYHAYSGDGDVTAPLVFVNYGVPADYDQLDRLGISVKGAIVIAKYGGSWRGIKPKVAYEHGAVGCIIYSDPADDGYGQGDVYPKGAFRPRDGAQRGSVMDMPTYPGDPLTPGVGATKDAKRLPIAEAKTIMKIPVLPISYGDAQPLLAAITGPVVPAGWRGALPITYHVGPGAAKVHLKVKSDWSLKPLYDVIARLPGSELPDEWVVRGNHHDGWVNGAEDPISGLVPELEEARALGALVKQGWKPRRTIIYAAWDGEEPALLGSTEWAETHADDLRKHAVAYINTDGNGRGFFGAGGSHSLEHLVNDVTRDVKDPETGLSVWKRTQAAALTAAATQKDKDEIRARPDLRIQALGSGSDFTPFLQHLGVAALNVGFGGEGGGGGVYHSIYDSFYWYTHFSDTSFVYGRALAQVVGTTVMRLANADVLPFEFTQLAETVNKYNGELDDLAKQTRDKVVEQNREIEDGTLVAAADPWTKYVPPPSEPTPPFINLAPLRNGSAALTRSADRYKKALAAAQDGNGAALQRAASGGVNTLLLHSERALTNQVGLPKRPWFMHELYAPGLYTGYGVKTIPGVREAIEQKDWKQAEEQAVIAGNALIATAAVIDSAATVLEGAGANPTTNTIVQ
jgi:N-acetylated-alpha-linked acidic dipeptidase